ncbi:MAG: DUF4136 domain-containing protein [Planctomycetota bacterium]
MIQSDLAPLLRAAAAPLLAAVAACAASEDKQILAEIERGDIVVTANGPATPLPATATYDYAPGSTIVLADNRFDSFAIEGELRGALERQLRERGFGRGPRSRAQFLLGYRVASADSAVLTDAVEDFGMRPRFQSQDRPLQRGALLLVLSDAQTRDVVWRGAIEGAIDPTHTEKERRDRIETAVALLLDRL